MGETPGGKLGSTFRLAMRQLHELVALSMACSSYATNVTSLLEAILLGVKKWALKWAIR